MNKSSQLHYQKLLSYKIIVLNKEIFRFYAPIEKGVTRGNMPPISDLFPIYYKLRGWDEKDQSQIKLILNNFYIHYKIIKER